MFLENLVLSILTFCYGIETELDSKLNSVEWLCIFFLASVLIGFIVYIEHINGKYAIALAEQKMINTKQLKSLEILSNNLERLLDSKTSTFADVTIKCGRASISAHKNILSARSPVFAAMFSDIMSGKHHNEVEVTDIDPSILETFLVYIYTGKTHDMSASSATDLLFTAHKYHIQDLKKVCSDILKDTLSIQNVLKFLILGDVYSEHLKTYAVDYICENCPDFSVIENTQDWIILRKEKPELAMDVLIALVNSKNKLEI